MIENLCTLFVIHADNHFRYLCVDVRENYKALYPKDLGAVSSNYSWDNRHVV